MPVRTRLVAGFWIAACLAFGAAAAAPGALADDAPTAVLVLDGSGSMWGRFEGDERPKTEIVRDVVAKALPSLKPDARLGLAAFGHRRRGSCSDAEVLVAPQAGNGQQMLSAVKSLSATGKGPIVLGLREAAAAIGKSAPATIILINDDVDNCGQSICQVAEEIAKGNSHLTVHTIGLGLDKPKLEEMSCLARATGGRLYNANDAAGLTSALDQIVKLANLQTGSEPPKEAKPAPAPTIAKAPTPKGPPGLYLSAGLGADSATLESPVRWRIAKAGEAEAIVEARAATLTEKLGPGSYDVEAHLGLASAKETVEVGADSPTPLRVNLDAGVLKMVAHAAKGGPALADPVFTVTAITDGNPQKTPIWIGREAQPEIVLPSGDYLVRAQSGLAHQQQTVKIAAATGTTFDAVLATGRLELSATRGAAGGEPLKDGVTFIVYEDDPDSPGGRREVVRSAAAAPVFTLPAGTYYVTARTKGAEARDQIAIGAGDAVQRALPLALAHVQLNAYLGSNPIPADLPVVLTVLRLDGGNREVIRTTDHAPDLDLSAGKYRFEAAISATNVKVASDVAIAAGQNLKINLKLEAGHVTLKLAAGAALPGDVYWEIKDASEHTVLRTSRSEPVALLGPGRYVVMTETGDRQLLSTFEVKAGEDRTIDING
jgi:Ca-activated chloride channel family protein